MLKTGITLLTFFICLTDINAQSQRFLFVDSLDALGTNPNPPDIVKNNKIRKAIIYKYVEGAKDSILNDSFVYDPEGYLVNRFLNFRGVQSMIDSLEYDSRHRVKRELFGRSGSVATNYSYQGDSVMEYIFADDNSVDKVKRHYNNKMQLTREEGTTIVRNKSRTNSTDYYYYENGLPLKTVNTFTKEEGPTNITTTEYKYSRDFKTLWLYQETGGKRRKIYECEYNEQYRCTKAVSFFISGTREFFSYTDGGLLSQRIKINSKGVKTIFKYHYYTE